MLEGHFKFAADAGGQRNSASAEQRAGLPQYHLLKLVGKFDGQLNIPQWKVSTIDQFAGKSRDFLMEEIFGPCERRIFNLNLPRIGLFGGAKREMCLRIFAGRNSPGPGPEINS